MTSVYKSISDLAAKNSETPQQIIGKLKKSDQSAIKALDVTSFEEIAQQLEHLTSIGSSAGDAPAEGTDSIDRSTLALALPISTLTRSVAQIIDIFDNDVSKFVADTDHKLNNLFPAMQERFCEMVAKCRGHHQDALRVLADVGTNENREQLAKTIEVLGIAPKLLQEKAATAGAEALEALASLKAHYNTINATGLDSIKNVRLMYRSDDGLAVFKKVKDLYEAWPNTCVCSNVFVCVCVLCFMTMFSAPLIVFPA